MEKITVKKDEGVAEIIDRVVEAEGDEVTVVIPKESTLGRSVRNFHLLKREADAAGKSVIVESVDEGILAFAKQSGLEGSHPLWHGVRGAGGVADIIPATEETEERPVPKKKGKKKTEPVKLPVREEREESEEEEEESEEKETPVNKKEAAEEEEAFREGEARFFKKRSAPEIKGYDEEEEEGRGIPHKLIWSSVGILVVAVAVFGIMTWSFGHVDITIDFQKTPWSYSGSFVADKSVSKIDPVNDIIPAQVFTAQKNTTQLFPASGNANVSIRAQGTLTIYNAYSSAKQDLVATTRFVTPDGKLFRLVSGVTVPGAQVTNGQIVPSSIDAQVVADQPGTAYNIGEVDKLMIPGFQGSPKYNAFYGQLKSGASGGFVGTKAVPTSADIASAKTKITAALQANLASNLTTSYPNNFKIIDGATNIQVTKLTVNTSTDANGNFSVFGQATLQAIGFDEGAFKNFLLSLADEQTPSSTWNTIALTYSGAQANFTKGTVSFSFSGQGTLKPLFDEDVFKESIEGESINNARTAIAGVQGLADGKISAWPMWLWSIPKNPNKIEITAN